MDLALYDAEAGYYARAPQRSGRAGDFFTSVDVGSMFGELLERQIAEMAAILAESPAAPAAPAARGARGARETTTRRAGPGATSSTGDAGAVFDLVEAGAGNGRLAADILRAARRRHPSVYGRTHLHLVEASAEARTAHRETLAEVAVRLRSSSDAMPDRFEGVLVANELLDAFPVHQVVMREDGLREVYVDADRRGSFAGPAGDRFVLVEGPPSTPALREHLARLHVALEPGWRVEINLRAVDWIRDVARRLVRGFIILIDYGHDARDLYSASHSAGTLTTYSTHRAEGPDSRGRTPAWLLRPGEQDITAHVDFTSVREAAEAEGLATIAFLDQTYFVMGLLDSEDLANGAGQAHLQKSLALKTLLMPGGLGSTHKVLLLGKHVGVPALLGCSFGVRVT
jgi:SAM-dependent MidA family methyltransferase